MILTFVQILLIVLILISIYQRDFSILMYIIFLPLNTILPSSYNLFGFVSSTNILFLITFIHLIRWKETQTFNTFKKISVSLSIIFLSYLLYLNIRHEILHIIPLRETYNGYIDSLRELLKWLPLILLITKVDREYFERIILKGMLISIIILVVSGAFAMPLFLLGFKIDFTSQFEYYQYQQQISMPSYMRNSGFSSGGDFNVLGATYNMIIAFVLCYFDFKEILKKPIAYLIIIIAVLGVILTGSRMAFITLFLVLVIFILQTGSFQKITQYMLIFIIVIGVAYLLGLLDFIIDRFEVQDSMSEMSLSNEHSRTNRWISYLIYSTSRINRFLFGYDSLHIFASRSFVDAHNLYIRMLYFGGISFVSLFLYQFIKLIKAALTSELNFPILLVLFPCFVSTMIIGQHAWIYYLLLIISINEFKVEK